MSGKFLILIEEPSIIDRLLWLTVSKKRDKLLDRCIIIVPKKKPMVLTIKKILLLRFTDIILFGLVKKKVSRFKLADLFHRVEQLEFHSNKAFNDWLDNEVNDPELQIVSVGCPYLIKPKILDRLKNSPVNLHNSDTDFIRGQFGTFWEFFYQKPKFCVLHIMNQNVDDGIVIKKQRLRTFQSDSLFYTLVRKKILGGIIIANFFEGLFDVSTFGSKSASAQVYGFPTLKDIFFLRWLMFTGMKISGGGGSHDG